MIVKINGVKYASQAVADMSEEDTHKCEGCGIVFAASDGAVVAGGHYVCLDDCYDRWVRKGPPDEYDEGCRRYHEMVDRKLEEGGA
jgi:hypothetical protein